MRVIERLTITSHNGTEKDIIVGNRLATKDGACGEIIAVNERIVTLKVDEYFLKDNEEPMREVTFEDVVNVYITNKTLRRLQNTDANTKRRGIFGGVRKLFRMAG